ncbi:MAG TPA: hypothetical protein VEL76_19390, partial [Gemmataceae bacterium]|nr:hypothetical protein [Gemmataceae bacterium]
STYERYAVAEDKTFLGVFHTKGLDGIKVGLLDLATQKAGHEYQALKASRFVGVIQEIAHPPTTDPDYEVLMHKQKAEQKSAQEAADEITKTVDKLRKSEDSAQSKLAAWWDANQQFAGRDRKPVDDAILYGSRMALLWTALVPATMAVLYLLLLLYFKLKGGYKPVVLESGGTELGTAES